MIMHDRAAVVHKIVDHDSAIWRNRWRAGSAHYEGNRTSALDVRYLRKRKTFARAELFRFLTHLELHSAERIAD
jgi:hypothetical protein